MLTDVTDAYDVVIVGSGAGGGTMARALAGRDVSVLVVERGDWLPQEKQNWDPKAIWQEHRYRADDTWLNKADEEFSPFMHYVVGGNTKFWGAVLYRLRESDFGEVEHVDGVSPAWPIDYATLEPWYAAAERLYRVRGDGTDDPTEPPRGPYPYPAVPHDPHFQPVVDGLRGLGVHPSYLPLGLVEPGAHGGCIRCTTCNSFPCLLRAKCDADTMAMAPAVQHDNIDLWTGALAQRFLTDRSGERAVALDVLKDGQRRRVTAQVFVSSAGAVNSTALMLRSANDRHPDGLANSSGLVGRRYMAHLATMLEAVHPTRVNDTSFQKTVAINDYYHAGEGRPHPWGQIQSQGRAHADIVRAVAKVVPRAFAEAWVRRGVDWLAMTEDLPDPDCRVTLTSGGRVKLTYERSNVSAHAQLVAESCRLFKKLGYWGTVRHTFKNENTTHQCGTMVFGDDPRTSVLDTLCRAHDLANLYVVDASFFPSSAAVNPGLTVIAQSLRVADHLVRHELSLTGGSA